MEQVKGLNKNVEDAFWKDSTGMCVIYTIVASTMTLTRPEGIGIESVMLRSQRKTFCHCSP